jgi:Tfp pilus assembly protein PilN
MRSAVINLLPTTIKDQLGFARRNAELVKYFKLLVVLLLILAGAFAGGLIYLHNRTAQADKDLKAEQAKIATYKNIENQVKTVNSRIKTLKTLSAGQSHFSAVLADLAAHTPKGASITALTLTGDDKKPVRISANADSYTTAADFRATLATSPRINAVDIESVTNPTAGQYHVELVVSYRPGQAK